MKCPRCGGSILEERERDKVTVDVCLKCRGVWLDRGELEKLIARATEEQDANLQRSAHEQRREHHDKKRHYEDGQKYSDGRYRKKSFFESLGDIFD